MFSFLVDFSKRKYTSSRFAFSLCSKISKTHVISLNHSIRKIDVLAAWGIDIEVWTTTGKRMRLRFKKDDGERCDIGSCELAGISLGVLGSLPKKQVWITHGFSLRNWIDRIMEAFNHSVINCFFLVGERHPELYLKKICDALNGLKIRSTDSIGCTKRIVSCMRSNFQTFNLLLELPFDHGPSQKYTQKLLLEDQEHVEYRWTVKAQSLKLNDLLASNCSSLTIQNSLITSQDINLFLKHWIWIKGFNWKLKMIEFGGSWDMQIVLKDIDHTVVSRYWHDEYQKMFHAEIPRGTGPQLFVMTKRRLSVGPILSIGLTEFNQA